MGATLFGIAVAAELFFAVWAWKEGRRHGKEKWIARAVGFAVTAVLLAAGVLDGLSRYGLFACVLLLQAAAGFALAGRREKKAFRRGRVAGLLGNLLLYAAALLPALIFPQYEAPALTGGHKVETVEYTWVDEDRTEIYADTGEKRALTVKFWYPAEEGSYPLVVFSHGAFGVIDSNSSTCEELASNGYVAVSIGHTYHAMYVKDVNGKITLCDRDFVGQVFEASGAGEPGGEERVYRRSREWMAVRTADENFVLDTILKKASEGEEGPFSLVDADNIGLFGHSLGGAASVQVGREREDIDAVIDLEGTMFGEYVGFEDGTEVFNEEAYPLPLLDVNSRQEYEKAKSLPGTYINFYVVDRAVNGRELVVDGAGHLNFTDLPMVSPPLAKLLGVGEIDAKICIEEINREVLAFFDDHLKDKTNGKGNENESEYPEDRGEE